MFVSFLCAYLRAELLILTIAWMNYVTFSFVIFVDHKTYSTPTCVFLAYEMKNNVKNSENFFGDQNIPFQYKSPLYYCVHTPGGSVHQKGSSIVQEKPRISYLSNNSFCG